MADMTTQLDELFDAMLGVEATWRMADDVTTDDAVSLWIALVHAQRVLGDLVKLVADDAGSRLLDRDDPRADYETAYGDVVHLAPGYAPERWRGRELLTKRLAERVKIVDSDGVVEHADVVLLDVLLDVLPGCADDDSTSSKWRTTGLRRYVDDWHRYRHRDPAPLVIKRGPRPSKTNAGRPIVADVEDTAPL